ncbi:MAG TPA: hypothetical protein ACFYED_10385 [Candidatus Tripitaka californicus]|uniref:hypothetical protein n=1 Tax=Candidatus Tripitaka californicus TaxID=3367616 RepID=UPI0040291D5D
MGGLEVAQPQYSRAYTAGHEEAWEGVTKTLEGLEIDLKEANKATGEIETKWFLRQGEKVMGLAWGGYWKMRRTLVSRGDTTVVTIRSLVEEKRPGGSQAYRWTRKTSTGEVEGLLFQELDKVLRSKEKK